MCKKLYRLRHGGALEPHAIEDGGTVAVFQFDVEVDREGQQEPYTDTHFLRIPMALLEPVDAF